MRIADQLFRLSIAIAVFASVLVWASHTVSRALPAVAVAAVAFLAFRFAVRRRGL